MKFLSVLSGTMALATGMAAAMPKNMAPQTDTREMMAAPNIIDVASLAQFVRVNEKEFTGPLPAVISAIGGLLGPGLAGSPQNAVAELFQGGDFVLNSPLDVIDNLLKLNIPGALRSALTTVVNTAKSLPKDATNIIGGGKKPEKQPKS